MMKTAKRRILSLVMALICVIPMLSSCAQKAQEETLYGPVSGSYGHSSQIAYTDNELDIVSKNGLYESFDGVEAGTVYASEEAESVFNVGRVSLVAKRTTFKIEKSIDGNAVHYYRSPNSNGIDPYFDLNVDGSISSSRFVCQADYKMGNDYNIAGSILQIIYRCTGKSGVFWSVLSLDEAGNIKAGSKVVGSLSKNEFTNVAVAVDVVAKKYTVYINGEDVATLALADRDITGYYFADVRVIQSSGAYTGGMYVDNIAAYEGTIPTAMIPDSDVKHTVNENFDNTPIGQFTSQSVSADFNAVDMNVVSSSDGNKFLSCRLKLTKATLNLSQGSLGEGSFVISTGFYRKSEGISLTFKAGYRDLVTVETDGRLTVDGATVGRTDTEAWEKISVAVRASGFSVYIGGVQCYNVDEDLSAGLNGISITVNGTRDDKVFFDDMKVYAGGVPFEFRGVSGESFTVMDYSKVEKLTGASKIELSDKYTDSEGNPLIKVSAIKTGTVLGVSLANAGFTGNPAEYDALRITFYCPEVYNYWLLAILDCGQQSGGWSYYNKYIELDARGWCTMTINYSDMSPSRTPAYDQIFQITFQNSGWGFGSSYNVSATNSAMASEVEFYIKSIELVKK